MKTQTTKPESSAMQTNLPKSLTARLLTLTAVLGLAACGAGVARAQSTPALFNGDCNLITLADTAGYPPVGWNALGYMTLSFPGGGWLDCEASEPWANGAADLNPSGYGLFFKTFEGSTNANPALDDLASCYFYQDNPSSANTTYTLSAYVGAGSTYSGYTATNASPAQNGLYPYTGLFVAFLDNSGAIIASNAYDLVAAGLDNLGGGAQAKTQYTTPVYTAPAGTATVRAGLLVLNTWGGTAQPSLFADDFDLESTAPPGSPVVTNQPVSVTVAPGGNTQFTVGTSPAATTYAWTLNGAVLSDNPPHITGSTTATLNITGATTNDVGHYQAVVSNSHGLNRSTIVALALNGINLFPTITLTGTVGDTYQVQRSSNVNGPYTTFTTVKLKTSPQYITDYTLPVSSSEFYKEVYQP